jgi:ribosomal protein S18 acetylase RimI-like enzyme
MGTIEIRLAEPRDDEAIGDVLVNAFLEQYARKMPEVVISERRKQDLRDVATKRALATVWVATMNEQVVGTVAVWLPGVAGSEAWLPNAADLRHLGVAAAARGQNLSRRLLDTAEAFAREHGCATVCLHVRRGAKGVRELYESRGYVRQPEGDRDLLPDVFLEALALPLAAP